MSQIEAPIAGTAEPIVVINQRRPFLAELRDSYLAIWNARSFIDFYLRCKNRSNYGMTFLKNVWYVAEPTSYLLIYYFLVSVIFQRGTRGGVNPFVFIMLGLVHYMTFRTIITAGMQTILSQRGLLLQMTVEPLVYFAVTFYDNLWKFFIMACLFLAFYVTLGPAPTWRLAFYPGILAVLLLAAWCGAILFGTLVVFCRDLQYFMPIGLRMMMYAAPVIYITSFVPETLRYYFLFNPVACLFATLQWCVIGAELPENEHLACMLGVLVVLFVVAHVVFFRLRIHFTKAF